MNLSRLLLASGSPQRRELLAAGGYAFDVMVPEDSVESGICSQCGPAELVLDLAERKARNVATRIVDSQQEFALILACDTVAECDGQVLGKPRDEEHARSMLERLRGRRHRVYSGLCLMSLPTSHEGDLRVRLAKTELEMVAISDEAIDEYLASDLWRGKAGAFGLQDRQGWLRVVDGSESNVIGLPMELLAEMLKGFSY